jgi:hypothetical protein
LTFVYTLSKKTALYWDCQDISDSPSRSAIFWPSVEFSLCREERVEVFLESSGNHAWFAFPHLLIVFIMPLDREFIVNNFKHFVRNNSYVPFPSLPHLFIFNEFKFFILSAFCLDKLPSVSIVMSFKLLFSFLLLFPSLSLFSSLIFE